MDPSQKKKLQWEKYPVKSIVNPPEEYQSLHNMEESPVDCILAFVYSTDEMKAQILETNKNSVLSDQGILYLAYPKTKNKKGLPSIGRDDIFPALEVNDEDGFVPHTDLKFTKMVSLDENYTVIGLKKGKREEQKKDRSGRVEDYVSFVSDLEALLLAHPEEKAYFDQLTPGYQKNWARYVYSAKKEETRAKRIDNMLDCLKEQIPSMEKKGK